jgi:hypothetical protein
MRRKKAAGPELVLNFRVPRSFARRFRVYAALTDSSLTALLQELFEERVAKEKITLPDAA